MDDSYYKEQAPFFGKWEIEEKLGEGGSGKVFLIADRSGNQVSYAAMKAISIPPNDTEVISIKAEHQDEKELFQYYRSMVKDVENELEVLDKLKTSKNVTVSQEHEIREHEDRIGWDIYIRQERLTPLIDLMATRTFGEKEIIKIGVDVCQALIDCEEQKIVHRDIKPENIFVDEHGTYKLGDFGIAKTLERTIVGFSKKGTYEYMAPEIYRKERGSASVDIYSLGLVLYKLLNDNRGPFLPAYPDSIMFSDRERALSRRFKGAVITPPKNGSKALKSAVLTACAYDPAERFRSASEFRDALLKAADSDDSDARSETASSGKRRKKRAVFAISAVAFALLVTWTGIWAMQVRDITGIDSEVKLYIGDSITPEYQIKPAYLGERDIAFDMKGDAASVSDTGIITAISPGMATMTMSSGRYTEKVQVTVVPKVTKIVCDKEITLYDGDAINLNVQLKPEKFSNEPVEFSSSDESVVLVNDSGGVTAKGKGETTVKIYAGGCSSEIQVNVISRPVKKTVKKKETRQHEDSMGTFGDDEYF